jgi:putative membrane protein
MLRLTILAVTAAAAATGCMMVDNDRAGAGLYASPLAADAYVAAAASADLFEIQSSQLALSRSRNPAIRSFAQMMVDEHGGLTRQLFGAASTAGIAPAGRRLFPEHADMLERLAKSTDFDRAYAREQALAHDAAFWLHRRYARRGDAPALRSAAAAAIPVIQRHRSIVMSWRR